ncbi:MAG: DUF29 domain-containing protein [Candidatus Competibacteraceae bacterium]|nr:DUF29 domain-containing protein [Candidatus Competibacteraceae bacterium]
MNTYHTDFYLWTQQQAALLRQGHFSQVDIEHIAEEIESMGRNDRRAMGSHLRNILMHLLKWQYQPKRRGTSWKSSINGGRDEVDVLLADSPSLQPQLPALIAEEYQRARRNAAIETHLALTTFPEHCPFTIEQITGDWWPD